MIFKCNIGNFIDKYFATKMIDIHSFTLSTIYSSCVSPEKKIEMSDVAQNLLLNSGTRSLCSIYSVFKQG